MKSRKRFFKELIVVAVAILSQVSEGQVSYERILNAGDEPQNWLTYNGGYMSQRHSLLQQIDRNNVSQLELKWVLQNQVLSLIHI